jgi:hypothetical protein
VAALGHREVRVGQQVFFDLPVYECVPGFAKRLGHRLGDGFGFGAALLTASQKDQE